MAIEQLIVPISAIFTDQASAGLDKVKGNINALGNSSGIAGKAIGLAGGAATAAAGAVVALGSAAIAATVGVANNAQEISRLSQATGVSVRAMSELQHVFERNKIEADELGPVFAALNVVLGEANLGDETAIGQLKLLGVEVENLKNLSPDEVFYQMADGVAAIEDPAIRTKAVAQVFGEDVSNKLIPALAQGTTALSDMADEARDMGLVLDEATVAQSAEFEKAIMTIRNQFAGLAMQVGKVLLPVLTKLASAAIPILQKAIKFLSPLLEAAGNIVAFVAEKFLGVVDAIYTAVEPAFNFLSGVLSGLGLINVPEVDTSKFEKSVGTEEGGLQHTAKSAADELKTMFENIPVTVNPEIGKIADPEDPEGAAKALDNLNTMLAAVTEIFESDMSFEDKKNAANVLLLGIADSETRQRATDAIYKYDSAILLALTRGTSAMAREMRARRKLLLMLRAADAGVNLFGEGSDVSAMGYIFDRVSPRRQAVQEDREAQQTVEGFLVRRGLTYQDLQAITAGGAGQPLGGTRGMTQEEIDAVFHQLGPPASELPGAPPRPTMADIIASIFPSNNQVNAYGLAPASPFSPRFDPLRGRYVEPETPLSLSNFPQPQTVFGGSMATIEGTLKVEIENNEIDAVFHQLGPPASELPGAPPRPTMADIIASIFPSNNQVNAYGLAPASPFSPRFDPLRGRYVEPETPLSLSNFPQPQTVFGGSMATIEGTLKVEIENNEDALVRVVNEATLDGRLENPVLDRLVAQARSRNWSI